MINVEWKLQNGKSLWRSSAVGFGGQKRFSHDISELLALVEPMGKWKMRNGNWKMQNGRLLCGSSAIGYGGQKRFSHDVSKLLALVEQWGNGK